MPVLLVPSTSLGTDTQIGAAVPTLTWASERNCLSQKAPVGGSRSQLSQVGSLRPDPQTQSSGGGYQLRPGLTWAMEENIIPGAKSGSVLPSWEPAGGVEGHRQAENWAETRADQQQAQPPGAGCLSPPTGITQSVFGIEFCSKVACFWVLAFLPIRNTEIW